MYTTDGTRSVCEFAPIDYDIKAQMSWLKAELERAANPRLEARRERARLQALSQLDPQNRREAYRLFGAFLGLLPPAAIFWRMFGDEVLRDGGEVGWFLLLLAMNVVCCLVGRVIGGKLASFGHREQPDFGARAWLRVLAASLVVAVAWAAVTGGAGGALLLGIGAVFGAIIATPVALVAFPVFAALHRLLAPGGMIEQRRLWPLALGIPSVIAAAILGAQ